MRRHLIVLMAASACTPGVRLDAILTPPTVLVTSHTDGDTVVLTDPVVFEGEVGDQGTDDLTTLTVDWTVDGRGVCGDAALSPNGRISCEVTLEPGLHTVALTAVDRDGAEGTEAIDVTFVANQAPTVQLVVPTGDEAVQADELVAFEATVTDPDGTVSDVVVTWADTLGDDLSSLPTRPGVDGRVRGFAELSEGQHGLTITVTDPFGGTASDNVLVQAVGSDPPLLTVVEPSDDAVVDVGASTAFELAVSDDDDAATDLGVTITSDLDGTLFDGAPDSAGTVRVVTTTLSRGVHTWTASVTDTNGLVTRTTRTLTVNGAPGAPEVAITPPFPTTTDGLTASVTVDAVDPDGDGITYAFAWTRDAVSAATGSTVAAGSTAKGQSWTVSVTASDGRLSGPPGTATVTIVDTPPTAPVVAIVPSSPTIADNLLCAVQTPSTDADGDAVTYAMAWTLQGVSAASTQDTWPGDLLLGSAIQPDETWVCTATPTAAAVAGPPGTAEVTIDGSSDADDDGLTDREEVFTYGTNPFDPDTDEDLLEDGDEVDDGTDPLDPDSDDDGVDDGHEATLGTDPNDPDSDDDGLTDLEELDERTDPLNPDGDHDGYTDGREIDNGTDPFDPRDPDLGSELVFDDLRFNGLAMCGTKADGDVVCWGENRNRELSDIPDDAEAGASWDLGARFACALDFGGIATCWGNDTYGQTDVVPGRYQEMAVGSTHVCARDADGELSCWGLDWDDQTIPPANTLFERVWAGSSHTCGRTDGGELVCWGRDSDGMLSPPDVDAVEVSISYEHACALTADDEVVCWGNNDEGQVAPVPAGPFANVRTGQGRSCAVTLDGVPICWGTAGGAQHPDLETFPDPNARYVEVIPTYGETCGLRTTGAVECWGWRNDWAVRPPGSYDFLDAEQFGDLVCGTARATGDLACHGSFSFGFDDIPAHTGVMVDYTLDGMGPVAVDEDGTPYEWGVFAGFGGLPTNESFIDVEGGQQHGCGRHADGTAVCWAQNAAQPPDPSRSFRSVTVGQDIYCGVPTDLTDLVCWGSRTGFYTLDLDAGYHSFDLSYDVGGCGIVPNEGAVCFDRNIGGDGPWMPGNVDASGQQIHTVEDLACAFSRFNGFTSMTCWGDPSLRALELPDDDDGFVDLALSESTFCAVHEDGDLFCRGDQERPVLYVPTDLDRDALADDLEGDVVDSDPTLADTDGDGLTDGYEVYRSRTDPNDADTDGDGVDDGDEVAAGTDPTRP